MSRSSNEDVYVGKYKLMKTIGKGNFAKVKLAKHMPTGQEVSRKRICVCTCLCMYVCTCIYVCVYTCVRAYVYMFVHMCVCVYVSIGVCVFGVCFCMCVYLYICVHVCVCWFCNNILFMSSYWFITHIIPLPPWVITCSHPYLIALCRLLSR